MIAARMSDWPTDWIAALQQQAQAMAEEAARQALQQQDSQQQDSTQVWRDARLLWPVFAGAGDRSSEKG